MWGLSFQQINARGLCKEKKRQRQSRKGLGKTIEPRATGQICRLGHNRWSFFNRQGQLLQATCAAVPCFKRSNALFTYDSANGGRRGRGHLTQGWFFLLGDFVCVWRGGVGTYSLSTDPNRIVCVVIATPITRPLHSKCVCAEKTGEDSRGFLSFLCFLFEARLIKNVMAEADWY